MMTELGCQGIRRFTAHIHLDHRASQRVATAVGLERTAAVDEDGEEIWAARRDGRWEPIPRS